VADDPILLLETDATAGTAIVAALERLGHRLTAVATGDAAIEAAAGQHLVIIDVVADGPAGAAVDICRRMKATPALAAIPVLCVSPSDDVEDRIRFLEAGADDVMSRPVDQRELEARVDALLLRFYRTTSLTPDVPASGTVGAQAGGLTVVFSPKGGVGTTTIAVNVAVALARAKPGRVALVDLDLQFGLVSTHLNVDPSQTLGQVMTDEAALTNPEAIRSYCTHLESGLDLLAAPTSRSQADAISPEQVATLVPTLSRAWPHVIVDAGSWLDGRTLALLDAAHQVIIPVSPEFPALKTVRAFLDQLEAMGHPDLVARTIFVVNEIFGREILRQRDIEEALGSRVSLSLPYDPFVYLRAANEGVPVVLGAPRSRAAEAIERLAGLISGTPASLESDRPARGSVLAGLLGRR
jgi:pilus assembly protein CpaE